MCIRDRDIGGDMGRDVGGVVGGDVGAIVTTDVHCSLTAPCPNGTEDVGHLLR